ncbi:MAG TPA: hypothetical protein VFC19_17825 [Candidatus Limnocylindrales bacterium]|nr:hypothetical protein [Candidatus Limnocylindrales bacterium]
MTTNDEQAKRRNAMMHWALGGDADPPAPQEVTPAPSLPVASGPAQHRPSLMEVMGTEPSRQQRNEELRNALRKG